jgi:hypothetical protein
MKIIEPTQVTESSIEKVQTFVKVFIERHGEPNLPLELGQVDDCGYRVVWTKRTTLRSKFMVVGICRVWLMGVLNSVMNGSNNGMLFAGLLGKDNPFSIRAWFYYKLTYMSSVFTYFFYGTFSLMVRRHFYKSNIDSVV